MLQGFGVKVNHTNYGTLFAALIDGTGQILTDANENGIDIPFLSTNQILEQLMKFGFYIEYDVKNHLPQQTFDFLSKVEDLGFEKITRIALESFDVSGSKIWKPTTIVFKSEGNSDLLVFNCKVTKQAFVSKLESNSVMNVSHQPGIAWDWVTYVANIDDILDENINEGPIYTRPDDVSSAPADIASDLIELDDTFDVPTDSLIFSEYGSEVVDDAE